MSRKFPVVYRLRNPAFGTETSERNLMEEAAVTIDELADALEAIVKSGHAISQPLRWKAEAALNRTRGEAA